jgi:cadmium resistance protein CadD (predicted permease)
MLPHIGVAILTFIITNVDDLIILTVFFANPRYKRDQVILGQIIGIFLLVAISMAGVYLGTILQEHFLNLLGLLPLIIGIRELINYFRNKGVSAENEVADQNTGFQFLNVAIVTLANGGDNLGVYMPLFANLHPNYVVVYALVFGLMTFVMCWQAYYLVSHPKMKAMINKYGHIILPIFLILLGLYILKDLVI